MWSDSLNLSISSSKRFSHTYLSASSSITMADISKDSLYVCDAFCCCFDAFYLDFPALIGCSEKCECLCINYELCLKLNTKSYGVGVECNKENICKLSLICCAYALKCPATCCKSKGQFFCYACQCAFPTDSDIPMMFALYGLTCCPKFACCMKVSAATNN